MKFDPAAMRVESATVTAFGTVVPSGRMVMEVGVLYVHPDSWERVSAMLAKLPAKR